MLDELVGRLPPVAVWTAMAEALRGRGAAQGTKTGVPTGGGAVGAIKALLEPVQGNRILLSAEDRELLEELEAARRVQLRAAAGI